MFVKHKNQQKFRDHYHCTGKRRCAAHSICNLRFNVPSETPEVFHNNWNYDYHFLIKELDKEFQRKVKCLGENTGKYIKCSDGNENVATISYK